MFWLARWEESAAIYRERFNRLPHTLPGGDRGKLEIYRLLASINLRFLQPLPNLTTIDVAMPATERSLDVYVFNKKMDRVIGKEAWVRSPTQVAMNFLGKGFSDTTSGRVLGIEVAYESGEENSQFIGHNAWVTVTNDGFADDSVRGTRYRFRMVFEEPGAWRVKQAFVSWRCWRGRGHEDYGAENCL